MKKSVAATIHKRRRPTTCQEAGRKGGLQRRANLTAEQRSEIGRLAVAAREAKRKLAAEKVAEPKGDVKP